MPITETTSLTTGAAVSRTNYKKIALCALALTAFAALVISNKDAYADQIAGIAPAYSASNANDAPPASTTMTYTGESAANLDYSQAAATGTGTGHNYDGPTAAMTAGSGAGGMYGKQEVGPVDDMESTFKEPLKRHMTKAKLALARAKRYTALGKRYRSLAKRYSAGAVRGRRSSRRSRRSRASKYGRRSRRSRRSRASKYGRRNRIRRCNRITSRKAMHYNRKSNILKATAKRYKVSRPKYSKRLSNAARRYKIIAKRSKAAAVKNCHRRQKTRKGKRGI